MSLELAAMRWLWLEQNCLVVLQERTPSYMMGQPDVLGITPGRYMTEIEIKRSASDFRADGKKHHRVNRKFYLNRQPRQFYYLMTPKLCGRLEAEIPEWAGLLRAEENHPFAEVVKRAPVNKESEKLNLKQCARLARQMTAHMMGYAIGNNSIREQFRNNGFFSHVDWIDCEKGTYEI